MPTLNRAIDLSIAKVKIAALLDDAEIRQNYPELAEIAFKSMLDMDEKIISIRRTFTKPNIITLRPRSTDGVVKNEDKYQQARD